MDNDSKKDIIKKDVALNESGESIEHIKQKIGICTSSLESTNEECVITSELLMDAVTQLDVHNFYLINMFALEGFKSNKGLINNANKGLTNNGLTYIYIFEHERNGSLLTLILHPQNNDSRHNSQHNIDDVESISSIYPAASWYEREISDGFEVMFKNSLDTRRLFLHEQYPLDFHPLKSGPHKALPNIKPFKTNTKADMNDMLLGKHEDEYVFKHISGDGVYQIPVGPVHAGIIAPGHFRFHVIGETIVSLEIRMFYKHRGCEKIAEKKHPKDAVKIAESICADETVANSFGFCDAVEKISDIKIPMRAQYLRMIMLELERIYSLLSDVAGMNVDIAYPVGAMPFFNMREEIFRFNDKLTGSRFMRNILCIGGLTHDIDDSILMTLPEFLEIFEKEFNQAARYVLSSETVLDRFDTTGAVHKDLVRNLNLSGPIAKACGYPRDARIEHPYLLYKNFKPKVNVQGNCDVMSRFLVKCDDIRESARLITQLVSRIPRQDNNKSHEKHGHDKHESDIHGHENPNILLDAKIKDGHALSIVESARGQNIHYVFIKDGVISRYKIRTASFCNWQAIEHAVLKNIVPDFPLINKSFNLSYAGTDL